MPPGGVHRCKCREIGLAAEAVLEGDVLAAQFLAGDDGAGTRCGEERGHSEADARSVSRSGQLLLRRRGGAGRSDLCAVRRGKTS